ncbi:alanine--tRNA ligase [Clostridium sp. 'deep sea']|uniref:alanine--tRNA ligase n=1 Tax=Clostridium sp. 'deep sea' TaxID=2779445 RepID=UPI0018967869|nr:alanine--tRNA ligase [Clostridium sp. 'deep sea']QOR35700.1 alanine--tRNA ligase [Clostridium sp. 'deep sea']
MKTAELRKAFLDFFKSKNHYILPSHSLIPNNDKTLLWINCGMAPLKKYYSKQAVPPSPRMANSQKSLRTNDIDNVGKTDRHHTMFEMLGNFSIGDYFKDEAISWSWEFLTEILHLDESKLYVTINPKDDEAFNIWNKKVGLPKERIYRDEENFWEIGPGPCGPNSEIHYDRGEKYGCGSKNCQPGCECDRYLEIWNLVFTQYNRELDGSLTDLPFKNIDTGMSLERLASLVQEADSNYEIDIFMDIIKKVEEISTQKYNENNKVAMRVIADHIRTAVFAIADGALPSNEGRGYVIRRIIRRAIRYGKNLNMTKPFLHLLVGTVINTMKDHYDYLPEKQELAQRIILSEEERFLRTLEDGEKLIISIISQLKTQNKTQISGDNAFKLYDTYGFPLELTSEIAQENNCTVDTQGFSKAMKKQQERARNARKGQVGNVIADKKFEDVAEGGSFVGYNKLSVETELVAFSLVDSKKAKYNIEFLLKDTPFYAESGGQKADKGEVIADDFTISVVDVKKLPGNKIVHYGVYSGGEVTVNSIVKAVLNTEYRQAIKAHHTCTHLLHRALKNILGSHVNQAGSLVSADRLRFDFTHFESVTDEQIKAIQDEVNQEIFKGKPVITEEMSLENAVKDGATALFGEKYGDSVRVVSIADYSKELCGGTHLKSTAEAGTFIIISEGSIGSGIRRIEAVASKAAYEYISERLQAVNETTSFLKVTPKNLLNKIEELQSEISNLNKKNNDLQQKLFASSTGNLLNDSVDINGFTVLTKQVENLDMNALRQLGDSLKAKAPNSVLVLGSSVDNKVFLTAMVAEQPVKQGVHAGKIIKEIAKICGGGGGGKPQMAQAGGKKPEAIPQALSKALELIKEQLQ